MVEKKKREKERLKKRGIFGSAPNMPTLIFSIANLRTVKNRKIFFMGNAFIKNIFLSGGFLDCATSLASPYHALIL